MGIQLPDHYKRQKDKLINKYGPTTGNLRAIEAELAALREAIVKDRTGKEHVKNLEQSSFNSLYK